MLWEHRIRVLAPLGQREFMKGICLEKALSILRSQDTEELAGDKRERASDMRKGAGQEGKCSIFTDLGIFQRQMQKVHMYVKSGKWLEGKMWKREKLRRKLEK